MSASPQQLAWFASTAAPAAAAEASTGVPAAISRVQAVLESGWGAHMPPGSNNPFGIKAVDEAFPNSYVEAMTAEYEHGKLVHELQPFAKYPSLFDAFAMHGHLLSNSQRYAPAMAVKDDIAKFAQALEDCGYSTNRPPLAKAPPYYADLLMEIVREYHLDAHLAMQPDAPAGGAK